MSADGFDLLRAADPAVSMSPDTSDDRDRLRRAIVATPLDAKGAQRFLPPRRMRPRLVLAAVIGGALVLFGGEAVVVANTTDYDPIPQAPADSSADAEQFRDEYNVWTHELVLPPGVEWNEFEMPNDGSLVGVGAGAMDAIEQAVGRWAREWLAADRAGDAQRIAIAVAELRRLRAIMPGIPNDGSSELTAGYDQSILDDLDAAIIAAKAGRFGPLKEFFEWARPRHYALPVPVPGEPPIHQICWTVGGPGDGTITADQARAEYRAFQKLIDLPETVRWPDWPLLEDATYMSGNGTISGANYAWKTWWREWIAADRAGDAERIAAAAAASARLRRILPREPEDMASADTSWAAFDSTTLGDFERIDAEAREGDFRAMKAWLAYQQRCLEEKGQVLADPGL